MNNMNKEKANEVCKLIKNAIEQMEQKDNKIARLEEDIADQRRVIEEKEKDLEKVRGALRRYIEMTEFSSFLNELNDKIKYMKNAQKAGLRRLIIHERESHNVLLDEYCGSAVRDKGTLIVSKYGEEIFSIRDNDNITLTWSDIDLESIEKQRKEAEESILSLKKELENLQNNDEGFLYNWYTRPRMGYFR